MNIGIVSSHQCLLEAQSDWNHQALPLITYGHVTMARIAKNLVDRSVREQCF